MTLHKSAQRALIVGVLAAAFAIAAPRAASAQADNRAFAIDGDVAIRINWQSFLDAGFPASIESSLKDTVISAYTRWQHVGGMRLKPKYQGYTTRTTADPNEILVQANLQHSGWRDAGGNTCTPGSPGCTCNDCNRLASRFGSGNRVTIVVHRRSAQTGTNWPHVFWRSYDPADNDIRGTLIHEFGHAFGLEHETSTESVMFPSYRWRFAYGPNSKDVSDIIALYGKNTSPRFHVQRSTNGGGSWANYGSNISGIGATTTLPPSVSRDAARTVLFFTNQDHRPTWIVGNNSGSSFDTSTWTTFGGFPSIYGTAGHGYDDEYMMAWVDHSTDQDVIKVVRSTDGASTWHWRNPPTSATIGTPAIHKVADNTWVLAYAKLGAETTAGLDETGNIVARVTTNDGITWGPEVELRTLYKAENSVSITSNGPSEVRIGFSWAKDYATSSNYLKRTIVAHVDGSSLVYDRMLYGTEASRTGPAMARTSQKFLQAWREPNYNTSINTRNSDAGSTTWDNYVRAVETSLVNPAIAAYRNWSYSFLYTLQ